MSSSRASSGRATALTLALTLLVLSLQYLSVSGSALGPRRAAPALSLKDASGKSVKLSDYKGRVVLLDF